MQDYITKAVTADGGLRVSAIRSTNLVQEARDRHGLYPVATAALGRLLTGGLLMASDFKAKERLNLRIEGDGPLGQLLVDAGYGYARGYVTNPDVHLPLNKIGKLDVAGGVGKGNLHVIKDLGLKEPYHSSVDLVSGEIAEDLTYYLSSSEQIPSAFALGVVVTPEAKVSVAGGFLIQVMPGCPDWHITILEDKIGQVDRVTTLLEEQGSPEAVVSWLLDGMNPTLFDPIPVSYQCNCSRDRMNRALISLGKSELEELMSDPKGFETLCHFCNEKYHFNTEEIRELINSL